MKERLWMGHPGPSEMRTSLWIQSELPAHPASPWALSSSQAGVLLPCFMLQIPHLKMVLAISTNPVPPFFRVNEHQFLPPFLLPIFLHHESSPQRSITFSPHILQMSMTDNPHKCLVEALFQALVKKSPKEGNPCSHKACSPLVLTNLLFLSLRYFILLLK